MIENENPKICYTDACPAGYKFHNQNSKICRPNCVENNPNFNFHKEGDFTCYNSCSDIPLIDSSTFIYQKNYICSLTECSIFSTNSDNSNIKICYNNQEECIREGYRYIKENKECIYDCGSEEFKVDYKTNSENQVTELGKCFNDVNGCKTNGYNYYNIDEKKCWKSSCPPDMKTNELDSNSDLPKEDEQGNTCVRVCGSSFSRSSGNFCKEKCSFENEFYDENSLNPNECKTNCGDKYIKIIGDENTCVEKSDGEKFYIKENNKKYISDPDCDGDYKYFFDGDDQCYSECSKIENDGKKYFFYNSDNKCLYSCKNNVGSVDEKYAEDNTNQPTKCKSLPVDKYYYEVDNIIRDNCVLLKNHQTNICVKGCEDGEKVFNGKCMDNCPSTAPYFIRTKIEILGEVVDIKKCVSDCKEESSDYNYILKNNNEDKNNNECMKSCIGDYYIVGDFCYNKCTSTNKFISPSDFTCSNSCGSYEFYEKLSNEYPNIYMCKETNEGKEYFILDNNSKKEIFSDCPDGYNFIGENNECKQNCNTDSNGQNYIILKNSLYPIYKCMDICNINIIQSKNIFA